MNRQPFIAPAAGCHGLTRQGKPCRRNAPACASLGLAFSPSRGAPARSLHPRRLAFTLIELIVTISIIVILVGLLVYAAGAMYQRSEITRTQTTLTLLDQALHEWQHTSDRTMTFGMSNQPFAGDLYDIEENQLLGSDPPTPPGSSTISRRAMQMLERSSVSRDMLRQIDPRRVRRVTALTGLTPPPPADGWMDIQDAWDKPIIVILPGREWVGTPPVSDLPADRDADGTIRTNPEKAFGIAPNRSPIFISAGPDGLFGDLSAVTASAVYKQAADNLYSIQPGKPN